ncbi:MAG TPA: succinylglutamate desuccinylase/aspartoacylase family protein [Myxococcota bacterium]|jgi:succinylglutamate desuccinylase|nr:succinylglutamate desuccinylase/aspartoacylase family protein [Myxococcota bacterium]
MNVLLSGPQDAAPGGGGAATTPGRAVFKRFIGRVRGGTQGPTVLAVGGVHGNEPAGAHALKRVLDRLAFPGIEIHGDFVALAGNVRALNAGTRYLERDLNRAWGPAEIAAMDAPAGAGTGGAADTGAGAVPPGRPPEQAEALERRELREAIDRAVGQARGPVFFMDLHSTSADGYPFAVVADTLQNNEFARHFPLPVILGLEELLDGLMVEYAQSRGCRTMAVEGGQHDAPATVENLEAAVWLALSATGLLARGFTREVARAYDRLDRARGDLPRVIEVLARHPVRPEHAFKMEPGFANIARTHAGQVLARDRTGAIRAPGEGVVLLPLYQAQGEDGFFLGREVPAWRLRLSAALRRARVDALLPLLPGVRRDGAAAREQLEVTPRLARLYPAELFQLFGFRKMRAADDRLLVSRRRPQSR